MLINKDSLIAEAAKSENLTILNIQKVHKALEETVYNLLSSVSEQNTKGNPVVLKIFDGISLKAYYEPEKTMKPNYADNEILVPAHIKIKADVTKNYCNKVNKILK